MGRRTEFALDSAISQSLVRHAVTVTVLAWCLVEGAAQQPAAKVTSVDVDFAMAPPGSSVQLPILLDAPPGVRVGTTVNEITFPANRVEFEEVRGGVSADLVEAEVTASVRRDEEDEEHTDNRIVQITVAAKQGTALPNGVLAIVVFKVSEDAPEEPIALKNVVRALSADVPPQSLEPVAGRDGEIEVTLAPPATYACFFYMH